MPAEALKAPASKPVKTKPTACPCGAGRRYAGCCQRLHDGEITAESPEDLMRSRYAAFALGRGAYLVETLASGHPDRGLAPEALAQELSGIRHRQRFLGLTVLWAGGDEVLFHARVFEKGRDRSFAELSTFVREDGRWKYSSGVLLERPSDPSTLDRASFLRLTT